ncbi:DUF302 domain-containing protein [Parasulfuritortus cantonensis]|uniref:DUF302 domain-containing protein n=1 Tax=Parasulfuritortus cantonensis TaxID=2528202 RepID=A0A4R1BLF6_9PROT|nr:DUF302 domain-containing protein [Parasulfuritortus cantonensis]TCJ18186.1 DUF302 domain-containing protein [Parasulfuritortus cantonensis]
MTDNFILRGARACLIALAALAWLATPGWAADSVKKPSVVYVVGQGILEMPLADGVSMDDAVESMKLRANQLNFKLVAELPLSKQVEAMTGKPQRRMTIYQFCDALTAKKLLELNPAFAAFLPCRVALVEDEQGKGRIIMLNMDNMIKAANLPPEVKAKAEEVRDNLLSIMTAGANGDI